MRNPIRSVAASPAMLTAVPENFIEGIDLSKNNGKVDWNKIKTSPPVVRFVYIKATEGVGYTDPECAVNAAGSVQAGIPFGFYHFATLNSVNVVNDSTAEANAFHSVLKNFPAAKLPPVLDIEKNAIGLKNSDVQLWISTFLAVMQSLGHSTVILYSSQGFLDSFLPATHPFGTIPLWLAQYRDITKIVLPKGWSKFTVWQYSESGKVNGISGNCDLDRAEESFLSGL